MPYNEMTTADLEGVFPQLGWNMKQAPLSEIVAVLDTLGMYMAKDHPAYNPDKLRADRDFAWGHVSETGTYPGGSYVNHLICVKSLRTYKIPGHGSSPTLILNQQCGTYQVELTNLSKL